MEVSPDKWKKSAFDNSCYRLKTNQPLYLSFCKMEWIPHSRFDIHEALAVWEKLHGFTAFMSRDNIVIYV